MTAGQLFLFGRFEAVVQGRKISRLKSRKVEELLCRLLLSRNCGSHREQLADQLWPDVDLQRSRKYLRQTLWQLQRAAESGLLPSSNELLTVDHEWIGINLEADLWVDVFEFQRAYESTVHSRGPHLTQMDRVTLRKAVKLYRGELLAGWYADWCLSHQQFYRSIYLAILEKLMRDAEVNADWEAGLFYGNTLLREDRANERAHIGMMRLHCIAGNRTAALRQFEMCVKALREEIDVEPDPAAKELNNRIRDHGLADRPERAGLLRVNGLDEARQAAVAGSRQPVSESERLDAAANPPFMLQTLQDFLSELQEAVAGHMGEIDNGGHE